MSAADETGRDVSQDRDTTELLKREQERSAQLETYAADLNRTYADLRRHLQRLTALHEVSTRIASALDPDEVVVGVLDSLGDLLSYETAAIYLFDLDVAVAAAGGPRSVIPSTSLPRLRAGRAADGGRLASGEDSIAADDSTVLEAMREQHTVGHMQATGTLELVVPLLAGGRALGALNLQLGNPLGTEHVKIIELLAAAAAVALQNAHLYQETQRLATTDALTGLSNYRHFHDLLTLEVQRARRMEYPIGLLVMDLDHFKLVNDRHGHPMGDLALQQVAEQLRARLRRTDVVGRIGGEEFAAILPGDDLSEVAVVAEKLRRAVEALPPLRGGMADEPTAVTLSIGGTSLPSHAVDAQLLLNCADRALYQAKRSGRNRVCLSIESGHAPTERWTA